MGVCVCVHTIRGAQNGRTIFAFFRKRDKKKCKKEMCACDAVSGERAHENDVPYEDKQ